eukprot:3216172-Amphidinium_carterae.1
MVPDLGHVAGTAVIGPTALLLSAQTHAKTTVGQITQIENLEHPARPRGSMFVKLAAAQAKVSRDEAATLANLSASSLPMSVPIATAKALFKLDVPRAVRVKREPSESGDEAAKRARLDVAMAVESSSGEHTTIPPPGHVSGCQLPTPESVMMNMPPPPIPGITRGSTGANRPSSVSSMQFGTTAKASAPVAGVPPSGVKTQSVAASSGDQAVPGVAAPSQPIGELSIEGLMMHNALNEPASLGSDLFPDS